MTSRTKPYTRQYPDYPANRQYPEYSANRHSSQSQRSDRPHSSHSHHHGRHQSGGKHERPFHNERQKLGTRKAMKNHFIAASGEFVGTFMFLWFAFAAHLMIIRDAVEKTAGGGASNQSIVFISLAYGFSLLVTAWGFYRISGGLFNPAVTLGMCLAGQLPWVRGLILLPCQLLGGVSAAALVRVMFNADIGEVNTTLSPGTSVVQGLFIEMFLTSLLIHIVLMLAAEKSKATPIAPVGIGLALFVAELAGVGYTGGSLNPTRSFAPPAAGGGFVGYHWIYWVGPFLGACISAGYYHFCKYFHYEEANPGQDDQK